MRFIIALLLACSFYSCSILSKPTPVNFPAPAFSGASLKDGSIQFNPAQLHKPTMLIFWASWCQPCGYEAQRLRELYDAKHADLEFLGISVDRSQERAREFITRQQLPYENVSDPQAKIADLFSVQGTPTLLLIDQQGIVRYRGYHVGKDFNLKLAEVLSKHGS